MKRFAWPLQRLLDITAKREQALRMDVASLLQQVRRQERLLQERLEQEQALLAQLSGLDIQSRLARQHTYMAFSAVGKALRAKLQEKLDQLQKQRQEKTAQLLKVRQYRQTLEKLREQAWQEYLEEAGREQQKHSDELAERTFVRKQMQKTQAGQI